MVRGNCCPMFENCLEPRQFKTQHYGKSLFLCYENHCFKRFMHKKFPNKIATKNQPNIPSGNLNMSKIGQYWLSKFFSLHCFTSNHTLQHQPGAALVRVLRVQSNPSILKGGFSNPSIFLVESLPKQLPIYLQSYSYSKHAFQ